LEVNINEVWEANSGIQKYKVVIKSIKKTVEYGKIIIAIEKPMYL